MNRRRILILDEDREIQTLFRLILEREGYEPVHVSNIPEAINLLRNSSYDLLIMSGGLLGIEGWGEWWGFYRTLKADPTLRTTAIIVSLHKVWEAKVEVSQLREIQENGDDLLTNIMPSEDFIRIVKKVLGDEGEARMMVAR